MTALNRYCLLRVSEYRMSGVFVQSAHPWRTFRITGTWNVPSPLPCRTAIDDGSFKPASIFPHSPKRMSRDFARQCATTGAACHSVGR